MKKLLFFLALVPGIVFGQTETANTSRPTISVDGSSKISIVPDMTELNIHLSSVKMNMADASKAVGDQTQQFLKILKQLGFQESDVKTTHFSAWKNTIYRENGPVDSGYVVSQNMTLKFTYNQSTIQKIAARFSEMKEPVNFSIHFFLSDQLRDKTEAELLSKAVADAKKKAANLASAAGEKLDGVKAIEYGADNSVGFYRKDMLYANAELSSASNLQFAPQEIELTEMVTVVWFMD